MNTEEWHENFPDGWILLHRPGHDAELVRRGHAVEELARSEQSAQAVTGAGAVEVRGGLTDLDVQNHAAVRRPWSRQQT
ncbi:hypothetical protein [Streptomyces phaeochromogenes]|uniref:hypothetical protein n=1 Tax=Streptomyces phaeochromogenes TaxID=1923 RepID=UPI002DDA3299|nr:hypothetical protein [Streptomyces phaeochromogenes]WRZ35565.1 hypothetical protein OG931_51430 [Streptomyces phaeochromogenes]